MNTTNRSTLRAELDAIGASTDSLVRAPASEAPPGNIARIGRLFRAEMRLFRRESQVLVFVVGFPVLMVLVLGGVFGTGTDDSGFEYVNPSHFIMAAYFGVVLAAIGFMMLPGHISSYREAGVLRRYDTAGFPRWMFPVVQYMCGVTFALMGFVSLIATAALTSGIPTMESPVRAFIGLASGTLTLVSIGVALGMLYPNPRLAQGMGLTMFFPMFLLAGGGPPPEVLTDTMRSVANWLPLTHVIRGIQEPWLGLGNGTDHLVIVLAMLAVSVAVWTWAANRVAQAA